MSDAILRPYRSAVIGCGWIGAKVYADRLAEGIQSHAGAYEAAQGTELVGLCDVSQNTLDEVGQFWPRVRKYTKIEQMLVTEHPEIISICTPDNTHFAVFNLILDTPSVRLVILEKPIAMSSRDAEVMLSKAQQKGVQLVVNYSRRFSERHTHLKTILDNQVGEIMAVTGAYSKGIIHNGSHWFDLVRWLIGTICSVEAFPGPMSSEEDPTCHVRVLFEKGISGFLVGVDAKKVSAFELDVLGTLGRLRVRDAEQYAEFFSVQNSECYSGYSVYGQPEIIPTGFKDVALRLVNHCVQILREKKDILCSGFDGLAALSIAEAARSSLKLERPINIDYGVVRQNETACNIGW